MNFEKEMKKLAHVNLNHNEKLTDNEKKVVNKLKKVSKIMDEIFLRQAYVKNPELLKKIRSSNKKGLEEFFMLNKGPWNRLDKDKPFIGKKKMPKGCAFYPEDMTKKEFENWIKKHPKDEKSFKSPYTVIKRKGKKLVAVPYSVEYADLLKPASKILKEAASITNNKSLEKFLISRSNDFFKDDYYKSELKWMDIDSKVELTIGPYETYGDHLFGYKTAFESYLLVKDSEDSKKLDIYKKYLKEFNKILPIDPKAKVVIRKTESPLLVVNQINTGGDQKALRAAAFNLPNDERIRGKKGSKKVMLKNVMNAKFNYASMPLAKRTIMPEQLKYVTFRAYFDQSVMHEVSHGLAFGTVIKNGKKILVDEALKELNTFIEEPKCDIMALYCLKHLIDKKIIDKRFEKEMYTTYLAIDLLRGLRFGLYEAHGKGALIAYNNMKEQGAINYHKKEERYSVNYDKMGDSVYNLTKEFLGLQSSCDYQKLSKFIKKYEKIPKEIKKTVEDAKDLPIDIYIKNN